MKGLIQRVHWAKVEVNNEIVGEINQGILLLLGVEQKDDQESTSKLIKKVCAYRIFADDQDKMNLSLNDIQGELLIVSQFTLAAETKKGLRPSFSKAGAPDTSKLLYEFAVDQAKQNQHLAKVATGQYGADMQVSLQNNGPVTFMLES